MANHSPGRLRRLVEELEETGLPFDGTDDFQHMLVEEIDVALRPPVHERRVPSGGTILEPRSDPAMWATGTKLDIARQPVRELAVPAARRFADGLSSWFLRRADDTNEVLIFDRPSGSERDLVVLASVLDATITQRHPGGTVRVVGAFGVLRWEGLAWYHEPPLSSWIDVLTASSAPGDPHVLDALLEFAVHDLGALGVGALLIYRPDVGPGPAVQERLPTPLPLRVNEPSHLAPLRHALAQVDGAAIFDSGGTLRRLGVRLVPSPTAEETVEAFKGTRHTSGLRYSYDDAQATVIAVSDDGPVSVLRAGVVLGRSRTID